MPQHHKRRMGFFITAIVMMMTPHTVLGFSLEGRWVMDYEKTLAFSQRHTDTSPVNEKILACAELKMRFTRHDVEVSQNYSKCGLRGGSESVSGLKTKWKYKVIYTRGDSLVTRAVDNDGQVYVEAIKVVGPDLVWIYSAGDAPNYDEHVRYYYRREKD